jgi:putative ABC transport system permease protein
MGTDTFQFEMMSYATGPIIKQTDGHVESFLRMQKNFKDVVVENPGNPQVKFNEKGLWYADQIFFKFFSFNLSSGNTEAVLKNPFQIVISQEMAKKYFGDENSVGKRLKITSDSTYLFQISGVAENVPSNSSIDFNFVASLSSMEHMIAAKDLFESQVLQGGSFKTYFKLKNAGDTTHVLQSVKKLNIKNPDANEKFVFTKLTDSHLKGFGDYSNLKYLKIFPVVALLILLLALVNYMSLSTARATLRAKEIGVRKVVGAGRKRIALQFYIESALFALIAFVLAYLLFHLIEPWFFNLLQLKVDNSFLYSPMVLTVLLLLLIITILIAGSYPSVILSSYKPVTVLTGKQSKQSGGNIVRKVFTVLQFSISIALIVCGIVIDRQLYFFRHMDTGINRENIVMVPIAKTMGKNHQAFKKDIQALAVVSQTSTAQYPMYKGYNAYFTKNLLDHKMVALPDLNMDENFIPMLHIQWKIPPVSNSALTGDKKMVINEASIATLGLPENPIGTKINLGNGDYEITAVVKNFNYQSLEHKIEALALFIAADTTSEWEKTGGTIFIKVKPRTNLPSLIGKVSDLYKKYDRTTAFDYTFIDSAFNDLYKAEDRLAGIFSVFTFITIFIACLGLFGLAAFAAQNRTKEIGIRKVLGASAASIANLLSRDFVKLVLLSIIIASPIAWWFMQKWLQDFAYKIIFNGGCSVLLHWFL